MKRKSIQPNRPVFTENRQKPFKSPESKPSSSCPLSTHPSQQNPKPMIRSPVFNKENSSNPIQKLTKPSPKAVPSVFKPLSHTNTYTKSTDSRPDSNLSIQLEKTKKLGFNFDIDLSSINPTPCNLSSLESQIQEMKQQIIEMNEKLKTEEQIFIEKNLEHDYLKIMINTLQRQLDGFRIDRNSIKPVGIGCANCTIV